MWCASKDFCKTKRGELTDCCPDKKDPASEHSTLRKPQKYSQRTFVLFHDQQDACFTEREREALTLPAASRGERSALCNFKTNCRRGDTIAGWGGWGPRRIPSVFLLSASCFVCAGKKKEEGTCKLLCSDHRARTHPTGHGFPWTKTYAADTRSSIRPTLLLFLKTRSFHEAPRRQPGRDRLQDHRVCARDGLEHRGYLQRRGCRVSARKERSELRSATMTLEHIDCSFGSCEHLRDRPEL